MHEQLHHVLVERRRADSSCQSGGSWPPRAQDACLGEQDSLGVYLSFKHDAVTNVFFSSMDLTSHTVMRLEPFASVAGARLQAVSAADPTALATAPSGWPAAPDSGYIAVATAIMLPVLLGLRRSPSTSATGTSPPATCSAPPTPPRWPA